VEGGDAQGGGKVAIAAAAGARLGEPEPEVAGQALRQLGQPDDAGAPLHWWTIDAPANSQPSVVESGLEPADGSDDALGLRSACEANVDLRARLCRDDVGASTSMHHPNVDRRSAGRIGKGLEGQHLVRQFLDGADAFLWLDARMSGSAIDLQDEIRDAFAGGFDGAAAGGR